MFHAPRLSHALLLVTYLCAGTALASTGLPEPMPERDGLRRVGGGQLTWLGLGIYDASLWTETGRYSGFVKGETVALSLWYQREFSRDQLLKITDTAWRKLGRDAATRERWLARLKPLWSDVRPGDNVTTVVEAGGPTRFYSQSRLLGEVDDPEFGPAFLSIWLDPRSVVRDLRVQLLGANP
jgi:hypothetical protein